MQRISLFLAVTVLFLASCNVFSLSPTATPTYIPTATSTSTTAPTQTLTSTYTPQPTLTFSWSTFVPSIPTQTPHAPPKGFEDYLPASLASIVARHQEDASDEYSGSLPMTESIGSYVIFEPWDPVAATVQYSGLLRPMDRSRAFLMAMFSEWYKDNRYTTLYEQELLVREGESEFWMPIQKTLVPYLHEELNPGDLMTVYVRLPAALHTDRGTEFMFLINDFHK